MRSRPRVWFAFPAVVILWILPASLASLAQTRQGPPVLTGQAAFADYTQEKPGTRRKITVADLPQPYATEAVEAGPHMVPRPQNAWPQAPAGFKVDLYADGLDNPRLIRTAPNGDVFLGESRMGQVKVFRGIDKNGRAETTGVFLSHLKQPFGIAFYPAGPNPQWIYIAITDSGVHIPYINWDFKARSAPQIVVPDISGD